MFSLRLVFLAIGISMTLSAAVFGGESPNDRISTILAVMTSISERVDNLVGKVGNMESKVEEIVQEEAEIKEEMKKRMDSMDTKMTHVSNKVDKVDQDVKMNSFTQGWRYLGRGHLIGGTVEESLTTGTTLSQCFQTCEAKHSADHQWNGFIWRPSDGACYCEKNDQGHDPTHDQRYMHFIKQ